MAKCIPTDQQREAYRADHADADVKRSVIRMISTGKGIDRARVLAYVSHDVDATGEHDTVGTFYLEVAASGETVRGYAEMAFNFIDGMPVAADFRDFHPVMKAV